MDAQRFDNFAKSLATRFSRRGALRGAGAAASATLLASAGIRSVPTLAQGNEEPVYTMIRTYSLGGPADAVRQALQQGYIADACKAPGFIAYFAVEDEDDDFATVAVFRTQQDFENFASAEANWIAQNLGDLLPAPDSAVSGLSYVHVGSREAFRNACPGEPAAPTQAAAPTATGPTAVPSGPTPTPTQAPPPAPTCTGQGCACSTGTQASCDSGLLCCPTTDIPGGPGVCQTQAVCYPNQCTSTGHACDSTCSQSSACPSCCTNYCNSTGQCDNPPAACTGAGCACSTGTQNPCDAGLICCGTSGVPGGPGTCSAQTDCGTPCTGANCVCDPNTAGSCDQGLICCAAVGGNICVDSRQCGSAPCSGDGCDCDFHDPNACDQGLVCCAVQSGFVCATQAECGGTSCSGEGCACTGGVQGACDDGLICCVQGDPGAPGTCQTDANCAGSLCVSEGCQCTAGAASTCSDGLVCCSGGGPGSVGTCLTDAECNAPTCTDNGGTCDDSCAAGDSCGPCCSGYCNGSGLCDFAPSNCISEGCDCTSGTDGACDDGLVCCAQGDPGSPGTCQGSC